MLKTSRSLGEGPRATVSRYVPSGVAAGNRTTTLESDALNTRIVFHSQKTWGTVRPKFNPLIVRVSAARSTAALRITNCEGFRLSSEYNRSAERCA
jgi:hypothetical protein